MLAAGIATWHHFAVVSHDNGVRATEDAKWKPQLAQANAAIATLKAALANQNAAIAQLGQQSKDAQEKATQASLKAATAAKAAEVASQALDASSRSTARLTKPCLPSKALTDAWKG